MDQTLLEKPATPLWGILSDVLLWSTLLVLLAVGSYVFWKHDQEERERHGETIHLAFKDVSQMGVGSPVNFMGAPVGTVVKMEPKNGSVQVQVKLDSDAIQIPPGSHFTVEFNGLAGAKSLEITPPGHFVEASQNSKHYKIEEPIRLRDVFHAQMNVAKALDDTSTNIYRSLDQVKDTRAVMKQLEGVNGNIRNGQQILADAEDKGRLINRKLHGALQNGVDSIGSFEKMLGHFKETTGSTRFKRDTVEATQSLAIYAHRSEAQLTPEARGIKLDKLSNTLNHSQAQLKTTTQKVGVPLVKVSKGVSGFAQFMKQTDTGLKNVKLSILEHGGIHQVLINAQNFMHGLAEKTGQLIAPKPKKKAVKP